MQPARILIVDAPLPAAQDLEHTLRHLDYTVVGTSTAAVDAVTRAGEVGADLVLMSLDLSGTLTPTEAAAEIRRRHGIPVVFLTQSETAAAESGATNPYACLRKPVDARLLNIAIEVALHEHRMPPPPGASGERLATFIAQSRDGILIIDEHGAIVEWNRGMERTTGIASAQALGQPVWKVQYRLIPPERRAKLDPQILKKKVDRGITQDVTEHPQTKHQKMEAAMRHSEMHFRSFFETNTNYCYMVLPDGTILDANTAALAALGYTREELIGKPVTTIYAPEAQARVAEVSDTWWESGVVSNEELTLITKSGERRTVLLNTVQFDDHLGEPPHAVSIQTDITDRKQVEAALRESEARFRRTFDQAPIGAALVSLDYRFLRVNQALCRLTGYQEAELLAIGFPDITHPDDLAVSLEQVQRLAAGEIDQYALEKRYLRKDGESVWVHVTARLMRDDTGAPLYYLPMMENISDRKKAEAARLGYMRELETLDRTNKLLLREFSHRVKNNLSAILGLIYAERRRLGGDDEPTAYEILNDLAERIQQLAGVQSLLASSGWRPLQLTALAAEIIKGAAPAIRCARDLSIEVPPSPICVTPEQAHHLALVLGELVMNSVKYGCPDEQLQIALAVDTVGDQIALVYRDSGPGYPDEVLAGGARSIGLSLLNSLVTLSLRGTWSIHNDGGAITDIRFPIKA